MAGQALIGRAVASAELCDIAVDDAHHAALALADPATAGQGQTGCLGGIEKGSQLGRPGEARVTVGMWTVCGFSVRGTTGGEVKASENTSKRGTPRSISRAVIDVVKSGEPQR